MMLRRKFFWVWPLQLAEGRMVLLEARPFARGMVRVRVSLAPRLRKRRAVA